MYDSMAVRAYWPQIVYGTHGIIRTDLRQRARVMHMDETVRHVPICSSEIKAAGYALSAIVANALLPSGRVTLVPVNQYLLNGTLCVYALDLLSRHKISLGPGVSQGCNRKDPAAPTKW